MISEIDPYIEDQGSIECKYEFENGLHRSNYFINDRKL